jgi:predicted NUDIX family phosphoesterase
MRHEMRKEIDKFKGFLKENSEEKLNISDVMSDKNQHLKLLTWMRPHKSI